MGRLAVIAAVVGLSVLLALAVRQDPQAVAVTMPDELSPQARAGQRTFAQACAECHGEAAQGTDSGPPLVHVIYEPGHHADGAFHLAVRQGVRAHHWRFGDMPPIEGVNERQVSAIIAFVRELQRANGIQ